MTGLMQLLSSQLKAGKRSRNKNHEGEEIKSHHRALFTLKITLKIGNKA